MDLRGDYYGSFTSGHVLDLAVCLKKQESSANMSRTPVEMTNGRMKECGLRHEHHVNCYSVVPLSLGYAYRQFRGQFIKKGYHD